MTSFIALTGTVNTRDLGGFMTRSGNRTRLGRIWRSDHLDRTTSADRETLAAVGVRTIVDLRTDTERRDRPNPLADDPRFHVVAVDLFGGVMEGIIGGRIPGDAFDLHTHYRASLNLASDRYEAVFTAIDDALNREPGPVIVHCTLGKDRTGMIAALLLLAAGVEPEVVVTDYAASDDAVTPLRPALLREATERGYPEAAYARLLGARMETMQRTLADIDDAILMRAARAARHLT
jgi:protein-tyrosine phosphatase